MTEAKGYTAEEVAKARKQELEIMTSAKANLPR